MWFGKISAILQWQLKYYLFFLDCFGRGGFPIDVDGFAGLFGSAAAADSTGFLVLARRLFSCEFLTVASSFLIAISSVGVVLAQIPRLIIAKQTV